METQQQQSATADTDKAVSPSPAGFDSSRDITDDRYERALTEPKSVTFTGAGVAEVEQGITTYEVELGSGHCECDDYRFHGDSLICKHVIRGSLAALFCEKQRNTELVARVARFANGHGCVHGVEKCNGPVNGADRLNGMPCQSCVEAMKSDCADEWEVWYAFARSGVPR